MASEKEAPEKIAEPREYLLRMDQAIPMPLGLEVVVTVEVEGQRYEACVPAKLIISNEPTLVSGWYTGNQEGSCVIVFPATSMGTYIWRLSEKDLAAIAVEA